jgi:hypothetical protein
VLFAESLSSFFFPSLSKLKKNQKNQTSKKIKLINKFKKHLVQFWVRKLKTEITKPVPIQLNCPRRKMCSCGEGSDFDVSENSKYAFVDVFSALALGISLFLLGVIMM